MDKIGLQNPVFATYVIAATIMILKAVSMSWLTVARMMREKGGYRSPEDLRRTPLNPNPDPQQLLPNERVERIRRIQMNDLENLPFFLVAGLLFVLTDPSLLWARILLYGYVVSRLLHFAAYFTAQTHDMRATVDSRLDDPDRHHRLDSDRRAARVIASRIRPRPSLEGWCDTLSAGGCTGRTQPR